MLIFFSTKFSVWTGLKFTDLIAIFSWTISIVALPAVAPFFVKWISTLPGFKPLTTTLFPTILASATAGFLDSTT